jgi:hypothetical protein
MPKQKEKETSELLAQKKTSHLCVMPFGVVGFSF